MDRPYDDRGTRRAVCIRRFQNTMRKIGKLVEIQLQTFSFIDVITSEITTRLSVIRIYACGVHLYGLARQNRASYDTSKRVLPFGVTLVAVNRIRKALNA